MSRNTPHLCSYPGCPNIVDGGAGRCPDHPYPNRRAGPTATPGGYGDRGWRNRRARYARDHPTCEWPGCRQPVGIVHHLHGLRPDEPGGLDPANLRSTCHHHHRVVTAHPDRSPW